MMVKQVTVPAHGAVSFSPGGYHLMCMQPRRGGGGREERPGDADLRRWRHAAGRLPGAGSGRQMIAPPQRSSRRGLTRRRLAGGALLGPVALGLAALGLEAAALRPGIARADDGWHNIDVSGSSPRLELAMTRATDGKPVTQADFKGRRGAAVFRLHLLPGCLPADAGEPGHGARQAWQAGCGEGAGAVRHRRSRPRHAADPEAVHRGVRPADRRTARQPGRADRAGAALPHRLLGHQAVGRASVRGDAQLGDLRLRRAPARRGC